MNIHLPLIGQYAFSTQCAILLILSIPSYRYRLFRKILLGLLGLYIGFKTIIPISRWLIATVKLIAWCGFYVHFFLIAVEYSMKGSEQVMRFVDLFASETFKEKMRMEREADSGPAHANAGGGRGSMHMDEDGPPPTYFYDDFGPDDDDSEMPPLEPLPPSHQQQQQHTVRPKVTKKKKKGSRSSGLWS